MLDTKSRAPFPIQTDSHGSGVPMNPVFIVGAPRSGTTLVQSLLSSLPNLAIPPEEGFILPLLRLLPDRTALERIDVDVLCNFLFESPTFHRWNVPRADIRSLFERCRKMDIPEVIASVYMAFANRIGPQINRWGAKEPYFVNDLPLIAKLYPDLRVIHVIRDGRDVLVSMRERVKTGQGNFNTRVEVAALRWRAQVRRGRESGRQLGPDRYFEIRYVDLVSCPRESLSQMFAFIDEPFSEQVFDFYSNALEQRLLVPERIHEYLLPSITTERVRGWMSKLSSREVMAYESIAGDLLTELRYDRRYPRVPLYHRTRGRLLRSVYAAWCMQQVFRRRRVPRGSRSVKNDQGTTVNANSVSDQ
jgi:hypothetical protein